MVIRERPENSSWQSGRVEADSVCSSTCDDIPITLGARRSVKDRSLFGSSHSPSVPQSTLHAVYRRHLSGAAAGLLVRDEQSGKAGLSGAGCVHQTPLDRPVVEVTELGYWRTRVSAAVMCRLQCRP